LAKEEILLNTQKNVSTQQFLSSIEVKLRTIMPSNSNSKGKT